MISTIKMKISVIGSSKDTEFFILRSLHLKKDDFIFSIFDSRESQNRLSKSRWASENELSCTFR